ncbi:6-bladed beta-propeller [Marinoscillum furvescens]|uniref:6-bladed beta-propeller protein n=1 Tax=Marinoscillum furvescens DSM 4134 TaxID=1122208 RepID=A0A3D9L462_MARFU|nr:6-bladed beta-propeller [Marinoscillum furvescens]RED98400.1 6-bladed beta-propeller protein [Marinoscillum furvescens DSM 4134]
MKRQIFNKSHYLRCLCSLFLVGAMQFGCNDEPDGKIEIDINAKTKNPLPQIKINHVVNFETSDQSIFGEISTVRLAGDRFYLLDSRVSKALYAFSLSGKFVNKTKYGKGPEEMINPYAFDTGTENDPDIWIYDQTLKKFFIYDQDLNLLKVKSYPGVPLTDFQRIPNQDVLIRSTFEKDYEYTLYDSNFEVINRFVPGYTYRGSQALGKAINYVKQRTLFLSAFDYHIYQLTKDGATSVYYLDFGDFNLQQSEVEYGGIPAVWRSVKSGRRVSHPLGISENEQYLLFDVQYAGELIYMAINKQTGKVLRINDFIDQGRLPKCQFIQITQGGLFYAVVEASEMVHFGEPGHVNVTEKPTDVGDNPFLITFDIQ